jgi:adenylosuccinate lyase
MTLSELNAISPIDGRYFKKTRALSPFFSEYSLIYYRLLVEIRWLESLAAHEDIHELLPFDENEKRFLSNILKNFNETEALKIKAFESQTNHDVKAVEYYLKEKMMQTDVLTHSVSFIHFGQKISIILRTH